MAINNVVDIPIFLQTSPALVTVYEWLNDVISQFDIALVGIIQFHWLVYRGSHNVVYNSNN